MGTMARLGGRLALAPIPVDSLFLAPRRLEQSQRRGPGLDSHVGLGGHGDLVPRVEGGGALSHDLGHGGCEDHVPCCQEECCHTVMSIEGLLVSETGLLVSQGPGQSRSYGSLYDEDVLLAIAICGRQNMRQSVSRNRAGRRGGGLTELCGCQNPFVEDDNAGAAGNPDTVGESIN